MHLQINFHQMESTDSIREKIEDKVNKLEKFFNGKIDVKWSVSVDKSGHHSQVTIDCNGHLIHAESTQDDLYKTFDDVLQKLERQLIKYKTQLKDNIHHKHEQVTIKSFT